MIPEVEIHPLIQETFSLPSKIGNCKVLLITGNNCSGKSFLRRYLNFLFDKLKINVWHFSQELKTANFAKVFLGNEGDESTGWISIKNLLKVFKHLETDDAEKRIVILDEPEIGLSEEAKLAVAEFLKNKIINTPKNLLGLCILTHSREIVNELASLENVRWINLNGYLTAKDWLNRKIQPCNLDNLKQEGLDKWRIINNLLKNLKLFK